MGRTTTAERLVKAPYPETSTAGFYVWSFPGAPIQVRLDLAVVARLAGALERGGAASGLLLGAASDGITEIIDFKLLPDRADPDYETAIDTAIHALSPVRVVGFYRTHEEDLLRLNAADYSLADAWFREPYCVFLLIRPAASGAANATFFFKDERGLCGDFPFLEFPFDAGSLQAGHCVSRAAREEPPAVPTDPFIPREPYRVSPVEQWAAPPRRIRVFKAACLGLGVASLLGIAGYGAFRMLPGLFAKRSTAPPVTPARPPAPSLGLRAERQNGDLKLTWNRESAAIAGAASGVLSILDGDSRRDLLLTAAQVRGGSLLYSPSGDQVQMQLAVTGEAGDSAESVIVILPKGGAPPEVRPLARTGVKSAPEQPERPAEPAARAPALKPFTPPETRSQPAATLPIGAPPAAALTAPAGAPAPFLTAQLREPPRPPAKPTEQTDAAVRTDAPPAGALPPAPYRPPAIVRQVMPIVPEMLRSILLTPRTAEVRVLIDASGKVVKAEGVPQPNIPRLLLSAAETAARQCSFRPALAGDRPVPSEMILRFQFKPPQ